ncbi:MAG: hypothetical protein HYW77_00630 [Parcubacteria group bacterium]|nr:hypothetical protein [Parcubacteria group bacterium]
MDRTIGLTVTIAIVGSIVLGVAFQQGLIGNQQINVSLSTGKAVLSNLNLKIGTWDETRGESFALAQGSGMEKARQVISENFPFATYSELEILTSFGLNSLDILFVGVAKDNAHAVDPLSLSEQTALKNFVLGGGCAVLLTDNDTYTDETDGSASIVNRSFVSPFNVSVTGTDDGPDYNRLITSIGHPLLNGVSSFVQNYPGWYTSMPSYTKILARNAYVPGSPYRDAPSVTIIDRNFLGAGSGPVVLFSDVNSFIDDEDGGYYQIGLDDGSNSQMLKNILLYCGKKTSPSPTPTSTQTTSPTPTQTTYCPQDLRRCPDGSYVGRTGPNCEFICPTVTTRPTPTRSYFPRIF